MVKATDTDRRPPAELPAPPTLPPTQSRSTMSWLPVVVLLLCLVGLVYAGAQLISGRSEPSAVVDNSQDQAAQRSGGVAFGTQPADPAAQATDLIGATAMAMGATTSVEFEVQRSGAPVYIDQFESIALDGLLGQFETPADAQATIDVTIDETNRTTLGAVAFGDEVWVSNPITGDFETLPAGYDLDPSRFFDPRGGWQPLVENLSDVQLVGIEDRDGVAAYHLRGRARAADVANITVGLIRNQEVPVDLWVDPGTSLVMFADFVTRPDGATDDGATPTGDISQWSLTLTDYEADFVISPPPGVDATTGDDG